MAPVTYIPPELPDDIDELFKDAPHSGLNFDKYDDIPVQVTGKDPVNPIKTFEEAGILEQCSANIKKAEFTKPNLITVIIHCFKENNDKRIITPNTVYFRQAMFSLHSP